MPYQTSEFQAFISHAQSRPQLWRFLLCSALAIAIYLAFTVGLFATVFAVTSGRLPTVDVAQATTRFSAGFLLFSFSGALIGLTLSLWLFYRRGLASLMGPIRQSSQDFLRAAGTFTAVSCVLGVPLILISGTSPNQSFASVLMFLPLVAALVLLQTGAEELFFRGFVLQHLAARFQSPWVWLILPSALFGILHYDGTISPDRAFGIVAMITLTGILWSDLTRLTGNIGAALGWHFANNLLIATFIGFNDYFNGFSLRVLNFGYADAPLYFFAFDPIASLVTWAILRRGLMRKMHQNTPVPEES